MTCSCFENKRSNEILNCIKIYVLPVNFRFISKTFFGHVLQGLKNLIIDAQTQTCLKRQNSWNSCPKKRRSCNCAICTGFLRVFWGFMKIILWTRTGRRQCFFKVKTERFLLAFLSFLINASVYLASYSEYTENRLLD